MVQAPTCATPSKCNGGVKLSMISTRFDRKEVTQYDSGRES
jgi:hypothetical protein